MNVIGLLGLAVAVALYGYGLAIFGAIWEMVCQPRGAFSAEPIKFYMLAWSKIVVRGAAAILLLWLWSVTTHGIFSVLPT